MEITVAGVTGVCSLIGIIVLVARGIVTRKDCKDCKTDIDNDFESGSEEFKKLRQVQTDQGEQLAGISATTIAMASNVDKLVAHHIGGG